MPIEEILYGEMSLGNGVGYSFTESTGTLTIRGSGSIQDDERSGVYSGYIPKIKKIIIPDTIERIGKNAFNGFPILEEVQFGSGVKSIGSYAFAGCVLLNNVNLSTLSQLTTIERGAFSGCSLIEQIIFPNSITTIEQEAFYGCFSNKNNSTQRTITLPSSLTSIGSCAFYDAKTLATININCKLSAFASDVFTVSSGNSNILYVNIPNFETNNESLGLLKKTSIAINNPTFVAGNLKGTLKYPLNITTMTYGDVKVVDTTSDSSVVASNVPSVLGISNSAVSEVRLPLGTTKIGKAAFSGCSSLKTVEILNSITQIKDNAFEDCTSLNNVTVPNTVTSIGSNAFKNVPHINYSGSASGKPWGAKAIN